MVVRTLSFALLKLVRLLSLLAAISIVSFVLVSSSPIDPIQAYVGADMMRVSPEQRQLIAEYWGLDRPPLERFAGWASALLQGNLGTSMSAAGHPGRRGSALTPASRYEASHRSTQFLPRVKECSGYPPYR